MLLLLLLFTIRVSFPFTEHVRQDANLVPDFNVTSHTRQPQGIPGHMVPVSCKNRSAHHSSYSESPARQEEERERGERGGGG